MAETAPTTFTPPAATVGTELWYSTSESGSDKKQIFLVQAIPPPMTAKEDITYRALESTTEFAVKGVRPYESIEVECIFIKEQYEELEELEESDEELWWFLKFPDSQKTVITWRGSIDVSISEVPLDDMLRMVIKIGKSTNPKMLETLPNS